MKNVVTGASVGGSFSAKAVESVDVITGGYEAKYGQAISGIVNVKLKEAGYTRKTTAEVNEIAQVGEQGQELKDFIERDLGPEGLAR